jgi:hypothetical protein
VLYTLADHNATVIALTDAIGRVVAQYGYTPYGDLLAAELFANGSDSLAIESLAAARGNRLGHQGLRTERFDRPWDGPMDIASAVTGGTGATGRYRSLCHNRNRLDDPAEGRFTGVDPNGLGVPVLGELAFGGEPLVLIARGPNLAQHFRNGPNSHIAYGNHPRQRVDPSGLNYGIDVGVAVGQMAADLVSQYSLNLLDDIEWAMDWDQPDEFYSRLSNKWVTRILSRHLADALTDAMLGPAAILRDIASIGEYIADQYIDDFDDWQGPEHEMAGTARGIGRATGAANAAAQGLLNGPLSESLKRALRQSA